MTLMTISTSFSSYVAVSGHKYDLGQDLVHCGICVYGLSAAHINRNILAQVLWTVS